MTPEEFKQICREFDAAPSEAGWTEGHPIFQMSSDNDCMKARIAELEAEKAERENLEPHCYMDEYGNMEPEMAGWMEEEEKACGERIWVPLYKQPVQPAVPDGYCIMPNELTAENGAKSLLVGEFYDVTRIDCPECIDMGDVEDDCTICFGEGTLQKRVPVSWTTIKAIYAKAVGHLSAAPKEK